MKIKIFQDQMDIAEYFWENKNYKMLARFASSPKNEELYFILTRVCPKIAAYHKFNLHGENVPEFYRVLNAVLNNPASSQIATGAIQTSIFNKYLENINTPRARSEFKRIFEVYKPLPMIL